MLQLFFLNTLIILWTGLILGVSFIATPMKFKVVNLTMPVALEVGRVTFQAFNKVEWIICLLILLMTKTINETPLKWFFSGTLLTLLLLETFWLLPLLSTRVDQVIAGEPANPGVIHWIYIGIDILKIIVGLIGSYWLTYKT